MRRILAIDGGGLRGVIPASFLAAIEERIGDRVANYFDLIAGTSTGGLIALGLGLGFSARDIVSLYEKWGPHIFPRRRRFTLRGITSPLYDLDTLRRAVQSTWGSRRLSDSRCRLLIPAYDLKAGRAHVWRTAHAPNTARPENAAHNPDRRESPDSPDASHNPSAPDNPDGPECPVGPADQDDPDALEVALSASAAPVYFEPYRSERGAALVDGGVWAQSPVLLAVMEAIWVLGWKSEDIVVLSLGCSLPPLQERPGKPLGGGTLRWGPRLPLLFLGAQEVAALDMVRLVLGAHRVVRISPPDPTGSRSIDNPADIPRFAEMGRQAAEAEFSRIHQRFFYRPAEPFVPRTVSAGPGSPGSPGSSGSDD